MIEEILRVLPDVIWYLTADGTDMWCRAPYGFFFSTQEAAAEFHKASGSKLELTPIGIAAKELVSEAGLAGMRTLLVTRIFLDPQIDPATGEVFGTILRIETAA